MPFHQFDLNLLRALDALLHERNVTRAAARLHVTQQAMSGALRRLREQFGDELLVRAGRGFQLSPKAAALAGPVRETMLQVAQVLHTGPSFDATTSERGFSVAMSDYAATTILPTVMARIATDAPNLVIDVKPIGDDTFHELENGILDLCLLPSDWTLFGERAPRGVRSASLYDDDFVCVVGHANRGIGETIDEARYLAASHTALRLGDGICSVVEAAWRTLAVAPRVAATATSFATMVLMVSESPALIATVQRRLAHQFARMLPIRILDCPIAIEPLEANMNWHVSRDGDPAHQFLRDVFRAVGEVPSSHQP